MAVVTPLNNFLGPEGDTVTVDEQLLNTQYSNGWLQIPRWLVGIRSPIGLVVGSCTSHPGVLGSIPKREEPRKTGAPCVKVPGSSRVPVYHSTCPPLSSSPPPRTAL